MGHRDIAQVIAELRSTADASGGLMVLDPGVDDDTMDSWPVRVPEDIRTLLRAIGGVRITDSCSTKNGHRSYDEFDFGARFNHLDEVANWYVARAGGRGTHWFVREGFDGSFIYVDVDPDSGAWGPVFIFWDSSDTVRLAESLPDLLMELAGDVLVALTESGGDAGEFADVYAGRAGIRHDHEYDMEPVAAAALRSGADAALAALAAGLPNDAMVADLRGVAGKARVDVDPLGSYFEFRRAALGRVLMGVPWDARTIRTLEGE
ncbi:SMI1/KNR4 family protein [Nocardia sp. CA-107356]|uniref:SMI1/KNR4 family protein n=1 Tax=Nocardia sp. CA-107356 TaxID=3239972 RepID=UPI003D94822B